MDSLWFSGCLINKAGFFKNDLDFNKSQCLCILFSRELSKDIWHIECITIFFQLSAMGFYLLEFIKEATLKHIYAIYKTNNVG